MKNQIDEALVRSLLNAQFPEWKNLSIRQVMPGGWDNRIFRLGDSMLVRLPSSEAYAFQIDKEYQWLPKLKPFLPLEIPEPLVLGNPTEKYPLKWSIYRWIEGEPISFSTIIKSDFVEKLAEFIIALEKVESNGGPPAGAHNFYRGGTYSHTIKKHEVQLVY